MKKIKEFFEMNNKLLIPYIVILTKADNIVR
jgi:hypothetical protein